MRDPELPPYAKLIALGLGVHTDAAFTARVARSTLAESVGVSITTVKRGLRALEKSGWISVERSKLSASKHEVNQYRWNFRHAGISLVRARKGRATRDPTKAERARVNSDPRAGAKRTPQAGAAPDPLTSSFYTIDGKTVPQRSGRGDGQPEKIDKLVIPDLWTQTKDGLK